MCTYEFSVECSEGDKSLTTTAKLIKICPGILLSMYSSAFYFFAKVLTMLIFFNLHITRGWCFKINSMHWKKTQTFQKIFFR